MIQPRKWWIGLPLLAVLLALAATQNSETIEKDIAERARAALSQDPKALDNPQVAVAGRDVTVSGLVLSKDSAAKLLGKVEQQPGVRALSDATTAPPLAKPFALVLERKGKKLSLSGNAPVTGERDKIRAAAAGKGLETNDLTSYAAGAPKNFEALANYGLSVLAELEDGKITISDAALSIKGAAKTSDVYDRTLAALAAPPAGAVLRTIELTPPPVSPYVWSAAKTGDAVTIAGFAPSDEVRGFIAARAAAIGAAEIDDRTRIASGAPAGDFAAAASAALAELSKLSQGKVALADGKLSIEGAGKQNVTAALVEASARAALPSGFAVGGVNVKAGVFSPYLFEARKDGATLTLSGYAPDADARAKIVERAKRGFDGKIVDRIVIAQGAPQGFSGAATASLRALARLSSGGVALSDRALTVEGAAFHAKAPADIQSQLAADLPVGFSSAARIGVEQNKQTIEASKLYERLAETAAKGISFGADNSSVDADSRPVLDALAAVLLRSPDAAVEIAGHVAGAGAADQEETVSKSRAQIVLDYLVRAGVDPTRLTAVGYGSSRPVAANDSEDGRAQNRRIEFTIK